MELNEKEKWYVDEVKTVKAIAGTVVGTRTRLLPVEYKQWKGLRGRDYLSKQRMKTQVRGGLLIVSEIRETLRLFTRLVTERDMLHEKDYIAKITKARESLGHNFIFSFASFSYCCSYTYFILVGPFCFASFVFHSAPGADFVWNEIFLFVSAVRDRSSPGAGFVPEKIVWGIRSTTVRLWDPGFCLKPSISVYVRDRLGACSLFGKNFC